MIDIGSGEELRELVDRGSFNRNTGDGGLDASFEVSPDGNDLYFSEYGRRIEPPLPSRSSDLFGCTSRDRPSAIGEPRRHSLAMSVKSYPSQKGGPSGALAVIELASQERRVWRFPRNDPDFFQVFGSITDTAWSPDGGTLAYVSSYEGSETRLLEPATADSLKDATLVEGTGDQPSFLPDGRLVFRRECCYPEFRRPSRLLVHEWSTATNSRYAALTASRTVDAAPTGHVLVVSGSNGVLTVIAPGGGVTRIGGGYLSAAW